MIRAALFNGRITKQYSSASYRVTVFPRIFLLPPPPVFVRIHTCCPSLSDCCLTTCRRQFLPFASVQCKLFQNKIQWAYSFVLKRLPFHNSEVRPHNGIAGTLWNQVALLS